MKLNNYNYSIFQYNQQSNHANFKGCSNANPIRANSINPLNKIAPYILGGMIMISCDKAPTPRFNTTDINNGVRVEYTNVTKETRDSVMKPIYELKSKLNPNNDFLDGVNLYITKSADNLQLTNSFKEDLRRNCPNNLKGRSFYSDALLQKMIFLQEDAHKNYEQYDRTTKKTTTMPAMRQTLMHETGHLFDNYFGHDHNADFALKYDSLLNDKECDLYQNPYKFDVKTEKDFQILSEYTKHSGLSDKAEFKLALLKDICKLRRIPENSGELPNNIKYYTQSFDLSKPIVMRHVDNADFSRSEIYANLFSYAFGEDEGFSEREKFIKNFRNSYKVVTSDIAKYLKIMK